jgi:SlyX protein
MTNMETRINELERHVAQQEQTIQELSDVLTEQWKTLDLHRRELDMLKDRLRAAEGVISDIGPPEPPPPHY